jgi:hypothetical protein
MAIIKRLEKNIVSVKLSPGIVMIPEDVKYLYGNDEGKVIERIHSLAKPMDHYEEIVIIEGDYWSNKERSNEKAWEDAKKMGFNLPTIETAFRFRREISFSDQYDNMVQYVIFMHPPLEKKWLCASYRNLGREGKIRIMETFPAIPNGSYGLGVGYAFVR